MIALRAQFYSQSAIEVALCTASELRSDGDHSPPSGAVCIDSKWSQELPANAQVLNDLAPQARQRSRSRGRPCITRSDSWQEAPTSQSHPNWSGRRTRARLQAHSLPRNQPDCRIPASIEPPTAPVARRRTVTQMPIAPQGPLPELQRRRQYEGLRGRAQGNSPPHCRPPWPWGRD
jgi:hypothetical protein